MKRIKTNHNPTIWIITSHNKLHLLIWVKLTVHVTHVHLVLNRSPRTVLTFLAQRDQNCPSWPSCPKAQTWPSCPKCPSWPKLPKGPNMTKLPKMPKSTLQEPTWQHSKKHQWTKNPNLVTYTANYPAPRHGATEIKVFSVQYQSAHSKMPGAKTSEKMHKIRYTNKTIGAKTRRYYLSPSNVKCPGNKMKCLAPRQNTLEKASVHKKSNLLTRAANCPAPRHRGYWKYLGAKYQKYAQ